MQSDTETISLEQKLRYLREVESVHRLSKKMLPPQGTTWSRIADGILRKALGKPVQGEPETINIRRNGHMHHHSPRTARLLERTFRNGIVHPDILHSFRNDGTQRTQVDGHYGRPYAGDAAATVNAVPRQRKRALAHTPDVVHYVQHGSSDLHYPDGHLQGYGFVPGDHEAASHVQLESPVPTNDPDIMVPTTQGVVGQSGP